MRKDIRSNIKKITALVLAAAMTLPMNVPAFADDELPAGNPSAPVETAPGEYDHVITTDGQTVIHHITYINQGDGTHKASCNNCTKGEAEQVKLVDGYYHIIDSSTSHVFDIVDGESHKCICGAIETDEELRKADEKEYDENTYLTEYLALKYPVLNTDTSRKNKRGAEYLSQSECNSSTLETIEIGNDNGNDATSAKLRELTKNMVNFNPLTNLIKVKTIKINVEDIRVIYLPHELETLEINNATLNIADKGTFSESENNSGSVGSKGCRALKNVSFNNVRIGVIRKGTDRYLDNYVIHINNSPNLESLNISVAFTEVAQQFTIDAGDNAYSGLKLCNITNNTEGTGRIVIKTSNNNSYFKNNEACQKYIISEAPFTNNYFRTYLLYCTSIDANKDGIITQKELEEIKNLTVNYDSHLSSYMDALHDLSDIALFSNLETLTIENTERRSAFYISNIAFPDNGKLESITIRDTNTKFSTSSTITIPSSVKNFVYTNTYAIDDRIEENFANIKIDDTGSLESVNLDSSNVKQIQITNKTGITKSLSLSATKCSKLEYVLLDGIDGSGYILSGEATFNDCGNLRKIGKPDADNANIWNVDLSEGTLFDISNCTNFGNLDTTTSAIKINSNNKAVSIMAYGVNNLNTNHALYINNNVAGQTNIILCFDNQWWGDLATLIGAVVKQGSSTPTIVVFPGGNILKNVAKSDAATPYERWVDRYEVEVASATLSGNGSVVPGGIPQNLTDYQFYVDEKIGNNYVKREIKVTDYSKFILKVEGPDNHSDYVRLYDDKNGFNTYSAGRVKICAYWNNGTDENPKLVKIGQQDILVKSRANDIDFTINNSHESGVGSKETPIYIERNSGILSLTAQNKYEGTNLPKEVRSIIWRFEDGNTGKEVSALTATSSGISVYRDFYTDSDDTFTGSDNQTHCVQSNTREFKIGGSYSKLKVIAQVPYNKATYESDVITKSCYVQMTGPCRIALSGDTLVQGANGYGAVDITLSACKNYNVTIKDAERYNNLLKVEKNSLASSGDTSVWTLSTNGGNPEDIKSMIGSMKSVTLVITADYGVHEKTVNLSSVWTPAQDSDPDYSSNQNSTNNQAVVVTQSDTKETTGSKALTYTSPGKVTVSEIAVVNLDGTSSKLALHADGTVSETKTLPLATVVSVNDTSTLTSVAPTVINNVDVIVNKSTAFGNSKIENITANLNATTINGNISITPKIVTGVKDAVSEQLGKKVSASAIDIKIDTTASDGKPVSVALSAGDLKNNATLKAYLIDPVTGGNIIVDVPSAKYNRKTGLTITGLIGGFEYKIVSTKESDRIEKSILNSVKLSSDFAKTVSVPQGSVMDMSKAISPSLNALNVNKIEYSISGNKAVIDPSTGLVVINGNASKGTVTATIKVTLKNGKVKKLKVKLKIG